MLQSSINALQQRSVLKVYTLSKDFYLKNQGDDKNGCYWHDIYI